jgi:CheY-like chemotaxis protein
VVTDYKMPRMNGLELIVRIRERAPTLPIILVSGYVDGLGLTEANTGADVVIPKSAHEVPQLVRSVNRLLRRNAPKKPAGAQRPPAKAKRQGATG